MQNKDKYISYGLIAAVIPWLIALLLCGGSLHTIWPDLEKGQGVAMLLGLMLLSLPGTLTILTGVYSLKRQLPVGIKWTAALLLGLVASFYAFFNFIEPHVFFREWLFDHDAYLGTIVSGLIPLFFYLIFCLASALAITTQTGLIISIVASVLLPAFAYLGGNALRFLPGLSSSKHLLQIGAVTLTSAFSFFLLRIGVYIVGRKANALTQRETVAAMQFFFVGIFPLIGLAANSWGPVARESQGILGNFSSPVFWILAAINGLIYVIPLPRHPLFSLALFSLRSAGFVFVLYFCAAFILFLPLALVLIAAIGLGLLLMIPYFAAAVQALRLRQDYQALAAAGRQPQARIALIAGLLLLPTIMLAQIYADRAFLARAIRYLEQPPLDLNYDPGINRERILEFTTSEIPMSNRGRSFGKNQRHIPIYDSLYRQIVFDGADLSENIRRKIRAVFGGQYDSTAFTTAGIMTSARLGSVEISETAKNGLTESTLHVTVNNAGPTEAEFSAPVELADGALLTGHWLTIDGAEVPAQITNRNTAIWIYNRITEARRDPSLIYFEGKDLLRWRIFPVPAHGIRRARIVITHAHDMTIKIAGKSFTLKSQTGSGVWTSANGTVHWIEPASDEAAVHRKPYLHFIAHCGGPVLRNYRAETKAAAQALGLDPAFAKISFVNTAIRTMNLAETTECPQAGGGFYAEMAIKAVLYSQSLAPSDTYPLVVILSPERPLLRFENLSYITAFYGDADGISLFQDGKFHTYGLASGRWKAGHPKINQPVRLYGGRYFAAAQQLALPLQAGAPASVENRLDGLGKFYDFYLGKSEHRALAVMAAVETNTLNPAAGSIVLESEAQRRRLAELHKKMLNTRNQLDTGETPRMSEPLVFVVLGLGLIGLLIWRQRKAARARIAWFDDEI